MHALFKTGVEPLSFLSDDHVCGTTKRSTRNDCRTHDSQGAEAPLADSKSDESTVRVNQCCVRTLHPKLDPGLIQPPSYSSPCCAWSGND
jgi:hypothetical protein